MTDLVSLARELSEAGGEADLPVEAWNPARCGAMDLTIRADGAWVHEGREITRASLVRLFSRVLRRDGDEYVLVTPAEKITIEVEDAPFLLTDYDREGDVIVGLTNVGDPVRIGPDHPLVMRESAALGLALPYVRVRGRLDARLARAPYYRLVDEAEARDGRLVIRSGGAAFDLGEAA